MTERFSKSKAERLPPAKISFLLMTVTRPPASSTLDAISYLVSKDSSECFFSAGIVHALRLKAINMQAVYYSWNCSTMPIHEGSICGAQKACVHIGSGPFVKLGELIIS